MKKQMIALAVLLAFVLIPLASADLVNWTSFRGVGNYTRAQNYTDTLNTTNAFVKIAEFQSTNAIKSSPTYADGYIYFGNDDGYLFKVDASNVSVQIANYSTVGTIRSSPAVENGFVYFGDQDHVVYQLNATDLSFVASFTTGSDVESSPAVVNGYVYVGSDDWNVYQLDANNISNVIATFAAGGELFGSPAVRDGSVYIATNTVSNTFYQLNASNISEMIASFPTTDGGYGFSGSPAVAGDYVYITNDYARIYQLNASNISQEIFNWDGNGYVSTSPAVVNGNVYFTDDSANVYSRSADNVNVGFNAGFGGASHSSPAVANGFVYLGTDTGNLLRFNVGLTLEYVFVTGGAIASSPAIAGEYVYIGSDDGKLYQLKEELLPQSVVTVLTAPKNNSIHTNYVPQLQGKYSAALYGGTNPFQCDVYLNNSIVYSFNETGACNPTTNCPFSFVPNIGVGSYSWYIQCNNDTPSDVWYFNYDVAPLTAPNAELFANWSSLWSVGNYTRAQDYTQVALPSENVSTFVASYTTGNAMTSSPLVDGGYVYISSFDGNTYQLDANNISNVVAFYVGEVGTASSPALANGYIYVAGNGIVHQLNASDVSQQISSYTTGSPFYSSPVVSGDYLYVGEETGAKFDQFNASDLTQLIASYSTPSNVYTTVAVWNGYVYGGDGGGEFYQFDAMNISNVIASRSFGSGVSGAAVWDGYVYVGAGLTLYKLNASNVSETISTYGLGGTVSSNPVIVNGYLYITNSAGVLLQLNATDLSLASQYSTGVELRSTPAVVNGYVYLADWGDGMIRQLNALDVSEEVANYSSGDTFQSSPAVVNGSFYIGGYTTGNVLQLKAYNTTGFTTPPPTIEELLAEGLVDYWTLNDVGVNTQFTNFVSPQNVVNTSGVWTNVSGRFGQALATNGNTGAFRGNMSYTTLTGDRTFSFWVKPYSHGTTPINYGAYLQSFNPSNGNFCSLTAYGTTAFLRTVGGGCGASFTSSQAITDNVYYNIIVYYNSTAQTNSFYVNGTLIGTSGIQYPFFTTGMMGLSSSPLQTRTLNGEMDEVGLWNRSLTADEIAALANGTFPKLAPKINLTSPLNDTNTSLNVHFTANVEVTSPPVSCYLFIDGVNTSSTSVTSFSQSISYLQTVSVGNHSWFISCDGSNSSEYVFNVPISAGLIAGLQNYWTLDDVNTSFNFINFINPANTINATGTWSNVTGISGQAISVAGNPSTFKAYVGYSPMIGDRTAAFWVKQYTHGTSAVNYRNWLNMFNIGNGNSCGLSAYGSTAGTTYLRTQGTFCGTVASTTVITDNVWYHIIVYYNASGDTNNYYVNGVLALSTPSSGSGEWFDGNNLGMGSIPSSGALTRILDGEMDEFGIWNRSLSADEIAALANGTVPLLEPIITLVSPMNGSISSSSVNFTATIDTATVPMSCDLFLNGVNTSSQNVTSNVQTVGFPQTLSAGNYTWYVTCGGVYSQQYSLQVANQNLSIELLNPTLYYHSHPTFTAQVNATVYPVACDLMIDDILAVNGTLSNSSSVLSYVTDVSLGNHTWRVDCAGGYSSVNRSLVITGNYATSLDWEAFRQIGNDTRRSRDYGQIATASHNVAELVASYSSGSDFTASPAVYGDFVYSGDANGVLYQFNASNVSQVIASYTTGGLVFSPTVVDGYVYVQSADSFIYKFNASNISQYIARIAVGTGGVWGYETPIVVGNFIYTEATGQASNFYQIAKDLSAVTGSTGNLGDGEYFNSPVASDNIIYGNNRDIYRFRPTPYGLIDQTPFADWAMRASPAIWGDYIYVGYHRAPTSGSSDPVYGQFNRSNLGAGLVASFSSGIADGITYSSPAIANGIFYAGEYDGALYQRNASNISQGIATFQTGSSIIASSPVVVKGYVYIVGSDNVVYQLNASNISQMIASYTLDSISGYSGFASPAVANGYLYIGSSAGTFYQLRAYDTQNVSVGLLTPVATASSPVIFTAQVNATISPANCILFVNDADTFYAPAYDGLFVANVSLADGNYTWRVECEGVSSENRSLSVIEADTESPTLIIESPQHLTYNNATILLNITAFDDFDLDTVWYDYNGTNYTYTSPVYLVFNEGFNELQAWANDTSNNTAHQVVNFTVNTFVDLTPPVVTLFYPLNNTVQFIENLNFANWTVTDESSAIMSCELWMHDVFGDVLKANISVNNGSVANASFSTGFAIVSEKKLWVTCYDGAGNAGNSSILTEWVLFLNINSPTNTTYTNRTINVNLIAPLNIWYNWNGTNVTYFSSLDVYFNKGSNTLVAYSSDGQGHALPKNVSFFVNDPTPPVVTINSPLTGDYGKPTQIVEITSPEAVSIWYGFNGTNTTYSSPVNVTFNEGQNVLEAWANDSLGYIGYTNVTFNVNSSAPTLVIETPDNTTYSNRTQLLNITSSGVSTWYNWNGTNVTYTSPIYILFNEGSNFLEAWTNNTFNIISHDSVGFTINTPIPDVTPPNVSLYRPFDGFDSVPAVIDFNWSATDSVSEVMLCNLSINGIVNASDLIATNNTAGIYAVDFSTDGDYYWNVSCADNSSNVGHSETRLLTIDSINPSLTILSPNGGFKNNATQIVDLNASDLHLENVWYDVGGFNITWTAPVPILFAEGANNLFAWARDDAGNMNVSNVSFTVDTIAPTFVSASLANNTVLNIGNVSVTVVFNDTNMGVINLSVFNGSGSLASTACINVSSCQLNMTNVSDGSYWYNASALDKAGWTVSSGNYYFLINTTVFVNDTTPPTVVYINPTEDNNSVVDNRNHIKVAVFANDTHYKNVTIYVFNSANALVFSNYTTANTLTANPIVLTVDGIYHFYATAWDNYGNNASTPVRYVTFILNAGGGGAVGGTIQNPTFVPAVNAQIQTNETAFLVNLESSPELAFAVSYTDTSGNPLTAQSASGELLNENNTVIKTLNVTQVSLGVYDVNGDMSNVTQGVYKVKINMDDQTYDGITAKVAAYPPVLGVLYDNGDFSGGRMVAAIILLSLIFGLGVMLIGSIFK